MTRPGKISSQAGFEPRIFSRLTYLPLGQRGGPGEVLLLMIIIIIKITIAAAATTMMMLMMMSMTMRLFFLIR